jgi:hypothetical protein
VFPRPLCLHPFRSVHESAFKSLQPLPRQATQLPSASDTSKSRAAWPSWPGDEAEDSTSDAARTNTSGQQGTPLAMTAAASSAAGPSSQSSARAAPLAASGASSQVRTKRGASSTARGSISHTRSVDATPTHTLGPRRALPAVLAQARGHATRPGRVPPSLVLIAVALFGSPSWVLSLLLLIRSFVAFVALIDYHEPQVLRHAAGVSLQTMGDEG